MGRFKSRDGRRLHSGQSDKQDTPVKGALPRRSKYKRLLPIKCYNALPEKAEEGEVSIPTVNTSIHWSTSVSTPAKLKSEDHVWMSNLHNQMVTEQEAFEGGETDRRHQNLTLEDISSSSFKIDMSSDYDEEEEEMVELEVEEVLMEEEEEEKKECYSSDTETSSSPPSPEVFREENYDCQTMTEHEGFEGGETDRKYQNLTLEGVSSSSFKIDMSSDYDEEEEEEEVEEEEEEDESCSSDSETSSSLPSPEIFRENYVESSMLSINEDLTGFPFNVKNSTLLDLSHAKSIHMHQPPDLSLITDAPTIPAENTCEISDSTRPAEESRVHVDSGPEASKKETPQAHVMRRPITYKKKVWFRSPLSDNCNRKTTSATMINTSETVQPCCPHQQIKPDRDGSRQGDISNVILLPPGKADKSGPQQVKVFDFADKSAMDAMLQKVRERCAKLKNVSLFPFTPAK